jgi:hypothetical protein
MQAPGPGRRHHCHTTDRAAAPGAGLG